MKDKIKEILREDIKKNILGFPITRPNQELVIMRGISGSGKSTLAKSLVREGVIHSTDAVIESLGDYREFFTKMNEVKDFSALSKAHSKNLKNAIESIKNGISPVILDNTNIKANEAKAMVVEALKLGLDDNMITLADIGTNNLDAKTLYERNTHGVPLKKIESMIESYKSVGNLTIKKILESKDMYSTSDVLYSCVLLDKASHNKLLSETYPIATPKGWKDYAHHMTINLGQLIDKSDLGKEVTLRVIKVGLSDMAMAVQVDGYTTTNAIPHITLAINPDGGKPKDSNSITKWKDIKPFNVIGVVTEIKRGGK